MKTHTKKQRELRNTLIGWLLVMPSLIFMAAFTVWPVFRSIWLSLTKYKLGMSAPEFIGLKNYISLAGSSLFWKVMKYAVFCVDHHCSQYGRWPVFSNLSQP